MIACTPLEDWIRKKTGIPVGLDDESYRTELERYQIGRLNETIEHARRNSPFYRDRYVSSSDACLSSIADLKKLPFTYPSDLSREPFRFLAVPQDAVARVITLRTSGSTGEPKRIFFTEDDLELTVDFFHHGMSTLVAPGQRVAILLPGKTPDSVGDLLRRGLKRMDVESLAHGPVSDPRHAAREIASFGADCLVGIPTHVLAVASSGQGRKIGKNRIGSVLLSTDYVPRAIAARIEHVWGCRVFNHYGMTETGLGGGVECTALDGYHLREADLFFEIVDRDTGEPCPDGTPGEVVFTTLTRRGMPLIRYRTGDLSRMVAERCSCGSALRRMERVKGRWENVVSPGSGRGFMLSDLDEALFAVPGVLDYRVTLSQESDDRLQLHFDVHTEDTVTPTKKEILRALDEVELLREVLARGPFRTPTINFSEEGRWVTTGVTKRKILRSAPIAHPVHKIT
jgi:phenylacetate-CoA ligase